MHNAALEALDLADEWSYDAIDVRPEDFDEHVRALPSQGFVGVNVTVPHKRAALEIAHTASDVAGEIGAANTLSFEEGAIGADNTDAPGFLAALPAPPSGQRALVLGAGGSARAVVWALLRAGARVEVWNRTAARARELARELGATASRDQGELPSREFDLVVNATSVGMERPPEQAQGGSGPADLAALHLSADGFGHGQVVVDLPYGSDETELTRAATDRGATVIPGLEVLVRQGAASFRIWTGIEPPLEPMRRAAGVPEGRD
jgi:shikimate dehydrogenase